MTSQPITNQTSKCCNAPADSFSGEEGTGCFVCQNCSKGCDVNPQTPTEAEVKAALSRLRDFAGYSFRPAYEDAYKVSLYVDALQAQCSTLQSENKELKESNEALTQQNKRLAKVEAENAEFVLKRDRMVKCYKQIAGKERLVSEESEWDMITKLFDTVATLQREKERLQFKLDSLLPPKPRAEFQCDDPKAPNYIAPEDLPL